MQHIKLILMNLFTVHLITIFNNKKYARTANFFLRAKYS